MTKPLNPEIKSMRRVERALSSVPDQARQRVLEYFVARECGRGHVPLPPVKERVRS